MARISISNIHADHSDSSLIPLEDKEISLVKVAVERALDARRIGGGFQTDGMFPRTDGMSPKTKSKYSS